MERIDAKVIIVALLPVLLLQSSSLVGAVDFIFAATVQCSEAGVICSDIPAGQCCSPDGGGISILVMNADANTYSHASSGGGCDNPQPSWAGNMCYAATDTTPLMTGVTWSNSPGSRRRSLLEEPGSAPCKTKVKPDAVVFTDDHTKGHWILKSSDAEELHSQMLSVPDDEKVNWLESRGATYRER